MKTKRRFKAVATLLKQMYRSLIVLTLLILLSCGNTVPKLEQSVAVQKPLGWQLPIEKFSDVAKKYNSQANAAVQLKQLKSAANLLYMAIEEAPSMDSARFQLAKGISGT